MAKRTKTGLGIDMSLSHDRFYFFNPNPKLTRASDCAIRALSAFLWIEWEEAYKLLADAGLKVKDVMNSKRALEEVLKEEAEPITVLPFDGYKPSVAEFAEAHKTGTYLLSVSGHYVTCLDGYYLDTWDCGRKKVYKAYRLKESRMR